MYSHPKLPDAVCMICKANNLSQSQFAAQTGLSAATIRKILNGGEVKLTALTSIASAVGMKATEFMQFLDETEMVEAVEKRVNMYKSGVTRQPEGDNDSRHGF